MEKPSGAAGLWMNWLWELLWNVRHTSIILSLRLDYGYVYRGLTQPLVQGVGFKPAACPPCTSIRLITVNASTGNKQERGLNEAFRSALHGRIVRRFLLFPDYIERSFWLWIIYLLTVICLHSKTSQESIPLISWQLNGNARRNKWQYTELLTSLIKKRKQRLRKSN